MAETSLASRKRYTTDFHSLSAATRAESLADPKLIAASHAKNKNGRFSLPHWLGRLPSLAALEFPASGQGIKSSTRPLGRLFI